MEPTFLDLPINQTFGSRAQRTTVVEVSNRNLTSWRQESSVVASDIDDDLAQ